MRGVCMLFFERYVRMLTYSILAYVNKNRICLWQDEIRIILSHGQSSKTLVYSFSISNSKFLVLHCVSKNGPTLQRYSSKWYGQILMIFGRNIQKALE